MKQCEICFDEFEGRGNQKYCKECGKDPKKSKKHYDIATYINKKNAGEFEPVPETHICDVCGKTLISIYGKTRCRECSEMVRIYNAKCLICNSNLFDKGIKTGRGFCSEECRYKSKLAKAIENGNYIPCKECGKDFISKDYKNVFCSKICFNTHTEKQRQSHVKKEVKMFKKNCEYCKKEFIVNQYKRNQQFCSKECSISHSKEKGKKDKEQNKEKIKESLKLGKELNICTICKTSQLDCERFTSNFVYMPTGAKKKEIDGKFVIVSCPKFK